MRRVESVIRLRARRSLPPGGTAGAYVPRSPTTGVLYGVVREHLADFLAAVEARTDGLPPFVVHEFRKFLRCGVHGAAAPCGLRLGVIRPARAARAGAG